MPHYLMKTQPLAGKLSIKDGVKQTQSKAQTPIHSVGQKRNIGNNFVSSNVSGKCVMIKPASIKITYFCINWF